ncbi:MAG TPA: hypothetical protein VFS15_12465, partial [Kofleriaceae bacterium]|nr:hypothetical protein [Kofleriaceae bacterium]
DPKPLREVRPELSEEFEAIVSRAMAKDRADRYANATEMQHDLSALLDDPTHSTERAKITGPRRLLPRPKIPRIAWAIGGIGIAIGGAAIVVMLLMGSKQKHERQQKVVAPIADAGTSAVAPAVDAPVVVEPEVEKITLKIVTQPPHAMIYRESEAIGPAPQEILFVKNNKEVLIRAQIDGYDDATLSINPEERADGQRVLLTLKKPVKGPPKTVKIRPTNPDSPKLPANHTGGELGNNPYANGGTVHKK